MEEVYPKDKTLRIQQPGLNDWMEHVRVSGADLPNDKGKIVSIHTPTPKETKFGNRMVSQIVIEGSDGSTVSVNLFLPQQFPLVHPESNLAKIMRAYGCVELKQLIGKEVGVIAQAPGIWKIKA